MDILVALYFLLQSWVVVSLTNFTCPFPGILLHLNRETPCFSLPRALTVCRGSVKLWLLGAQSSCCPGFVSSSLKQSSYITRYSEGYVFSQEIIKWAFFYFYFLEAKGLRPIPYNPEWFFSLSSLRMMRNVRIWPTIEANYDSPAIRLRFEEVLNEHLSSNASEHAAVELTELWFLSQEQPPHDSPTSVFSTKLLDRPLWSAIVFCHLCFSSLSLSCCHTWGKQCVIWSQMPLFVLIHRFNILWLPAILLLWQDPRAPWR